MEGIAKVGTPICVPSRVRPGAHGLSGGGLECTRCWVLARRQIAAVACLLLRLRSAALHLWPWSFHSPLPLLHVASLPQGGVDLGRIASLEKDHKPVDTARKGDAVAMKIEVGAGLCCWAAAVSGGMGCCWQLSRVAGVTAGSWHGVCARNHMGQ